MVLAEVLEVSIDYLVANASRKNGKEYAIEELAAYLQTLTKDKVETVTRVARAMFAKV